MEYELRTLARNEDKSYDRLKERGVKFWSTVEIETATWFVIEALVEIPTGYKHRRWLTTSVDAVSRVQWQEKFHWCRVFLCIQGPLSQTGKTLFVELREAYKSGLGAHFYVLKMERT